MARRLTAIGRTSGIICTDADIDPAEEPGRQQRQQRSPEPIGTLVDQSIEGFLDLRLLALTGSGLLRAGHRFFAGDQFPFSRYGSRPCIREVSGPAPTIP
jgi:hypothetical protein